MKRLMPAVVAVFSLLIPAGSALGATWKSKNFVVKARRADVAEKVARYAEYYRREKAVEWLGQEIPNWDKPCSVTVKVTFGGAGGATAFTFDKGEILNQQMTVEGPLDRILESVLPHEVTHTVFAARFRRPLPRWADEGGAVLSEDYQELARHDLMVREMINGGRMIPLRRLFVLTEYPRDVMALYAQGFSVANYLVSLKGQEYGRQTFLDFAWDGQEQGWDNAVRRHYGFNNVNELEQAWINWLIDGKGTGADRATRLAMADKRANRTIGKERIVRGAMPEETTTQPSTHAYRDAGGARQAGQGAPDWTRSALTARQSGQGDPRTAAPIGMRPLPPKQEQSAPATTNPSPRRRLIPVAVGRTRRSHSS
ncbi:hypothetical protein Pan216_06390 [Planctomycetes bacterium Pan216]|uniref:Peptidase MA-like domain-containing protein n=1 Tax=Kolteria novifilia TaxID=2527975 RepID=A0A518AYK4_9BACT|nr:hypothetical protein Pan216_06390 [Planctomycetes bacterium Pan216]